MEAAILPPTKKKWSQSLAIVGEGDRCRLSSGMGRQLKVTFQIMDKEKHMECQDSGSAIFARMLEDTSLQTVEQDRQPLSRFVGNWNFTQTRTFSLHSPIKVVSGVV